MPTIAEAGLPGYEVNNWVGFLAPAKTDPKIVARLHDEAAAILNESANKKYLVEAGFEPVVSTPKEFAAQLTSDVKKWREVAERAGISGH